MNALPTAAAVAVLTAAAVASAAHGLRPQRRSLAEVRTLLYPTDANVRRGPSSVRLQSITRWVGSSLDGGLRFVDLDASTVATRIVVAASIGTFTVLLTEVSLVGIGVAPASPLWVVLALASGAAAAWITWSGVRTKIDRCRKEFRRTCNDFIQLVAVGLTTDQSVDEAIHFALGVGDSKMFALIRDELATAPLRGVPLWEALDQLGIRYHQRELSELGNSIERQGTQGVSITDTVTSMATAMRERALDELEREADTANANLSGPTICFVVTTIVFLAYPLAMRIGEAFGG